MFSCRTRSPPSYADLQSHTSYQQHTIAPRVIEWTEVQSVASSKVAYAEHPRPDCARADGRRRNKASMQYNKVCKDLSLLPQHQRVYIQVDPQCNRWMQATVTETPSPSRLRSYDVETTDGFHLVRNRCFLVPAREEPIRQTAGSPNVPDHRSSTSKRPRYVINKPNRLIESI